jgi:group I intron endonuclease
MKRYIYKTTNLANGKIYVGQTHRTRNIEKYFGSGHFITKAILKHGLANFKKEILEECYSQEELNARERYWITTLNSKAPAGYNIADGGHFWPIHRGPLSEKHKQKLRDNMLGIPKSEAHKAALTASRLGQKNHMWGKRHSDKTILQMRQSAKNRVRHKCGPRNTNNILLAQLRAYYVSSPQLTC